MGLLVIGGFGESALEGVEIEGVELDSVEEGLVVVEL